MAAYRKANEEDFLAKVAKQEEMLARMRQDIKSGQEEIRSTIGSIEDKMKVAIQSVRSEAQETIQH
jgi:hypothetical protein